MAKKNGPPRPPTTHELQKRIEDLEERKEASSEIPAKVIMVRFIDGLIEFSTMVKGRYVVGRQEEATVAFSQFCRRLNEEIRKHEG